MASSILLAIVSTMILAGHSAAQPLAPDAPRVFVLVAANLRAGPGLTFPTIGQASPGEEYRVLDQAQDCR